MEIPMPHRFYVLLSRACLVALITSLAACDQAATSPVAPSTLPAATVPPRVDVPPGVAVMAIYAFTSELSYPVTAYTRASRYVFFDNGRFVLQYTSLGREYAGWYAAAPDGGLQLTWEGWSVAGAWGATGTLTDDTLTVRYNVVMQWTDFDDAVYALTEAP
jgi:hypothetical protein